MSVLFEDGTSASARQVTAALQEMLQSGQSVLDDLDHARTDTLLRFEQGLSALNNRRTQANRILTPDIPCRFLVSDFLNLNQQLSSATVRIDSQSVTLKERSQPSDVVVRSQRFSTSTGAIEQFNSMYSVHVNDGSRPVGTFDIEFLEVVDLTVAVIDIVSLPSDPVISVSVSPDGVSYTPASSVALAGYRINAWFTPMPVRYIRLVVEPTHPDTIGGTTFTFGVTSFSASIVQYHLASSLFTLPVHFTPRTSQVRFQANQDSGLTYYLSFDEGEFFQVIPNQILNIPGASDVTDNLRIRNDYVLADGVDQANLVPYSVPDSLYPSSLSVRLVNPATNQASIVPVAFDFSPVAQPPVTPVLGIFGGHFLYAPLSTQLLGQLQLPLLSGATNPFQISYTTGPALISATLHVQLVSQDSSITPVFTGAWFENVY